MQSFQLFPVDTLFFRDARPMQAGAGSGGHGAHWPLPTVVHEALRSELLRAAGAENTGKLRLHHKRSDRSNERLRYVASDEFRSLRTLGPFPHDGTKLFLPTPQDLVDRGDGTVDLLTPETVPPGAASNLPRPWLRLLPSPARPSKLLWANWVSLDWYIDYLHRGAGIPVPGSDHQLFDSEPRIGVAIDSATGAAREGQLYASEHLRLRDGVSLWFRAGLSERDIEHNPEGISPDGFEGETFPLGGESRMVRLQKSADNCLEKLEKPQLTSCRVKWVLLTHAVFNNGWLPSWVDEASGTVMLKAGDTARHAGEPRLEWRNRVRAMPPIGARLVAARVPKPIVFSGWDSQLETPNSCHPSQLGGPKPSFMAVPAGSVYYFEADCQADAETLVDELWLRTRSDCFGEKGMGLGVCGRWEAESK